MAIMTDDRRGKTERLMDFLRTSPAQAVIWVSSAVILSFIGWYVVSKFRDRSGRGDTTSDHLTKFREMKRRGVLSDDEFRTIKTALGHKLHDEITRDEERA